MIDYTSVYDSQAKRWNFTLRDHQLPERIIGEFLTDEELEMADNKREMVKAFLQGMCFRWLRNFGQELQVIDEGPDKELIVRAVDV